jgi:putative tRNA adenosine deaminase-associated protein
VSYFAAALTRTPQGWQGQELDLDGLDDLEAVTDALRDLDGEGTALLLLEQDDEWLGVVRVDGDGDPRVFLSDRRAALASDVAALLWDVEEDEAPEDLEDESSRPVAEPVGDAALLADLGTPEAALLELCAEEGLLPADVLSAVGERAGFLDVLDGLREV